jgi:hypothetical protein
MSRNYLVFGDIEGNITAAVSPHGLYGTAGVGASWTFVPHWSVISEQTNPRFQSGLRYSPTKDIDFDVIYGRNLLGEWANGITVGVTVRIGNN